jgi:predicted phosphoribosyltransferase/predicted alpha/beta-hydrolase family hydrolase
MTETHLPFRDRRHAGEVLAELLRPMKMHHPVVVGLPRGGVVVAAAVAAALDLPLEVLVAHKIGAPGHGEVAIGAVGEGGAVVVNPGLIRQLGLSDARFQTLVHRERMQVEARARRLRGGRPMRSFRGGTVILVDDGLATGATARAAADVARHMGAVRVVLAVPVAPRHGVDTRNLGVDQLVCVETPANFVAVGQWYKDFRQVSDDEVIAALTHVPDGPRSPATTEVLIPAGRAVLTGDLVEPVGAAGIVLFAHGSGSSRLSPRNQAVARHLQRAGLATLLFDLLTVSEANDRRNVFDVPLLAARLEAATRTATGRVGRLPIGYFGASTGAAAALWAAADLRGEIGAVVSRGGRPDLALPRLGEVVAPTLFVVGELDVSVIELTQRIQPHVGAANELRIVPGASHLFEEQGALDAVAALAASWFLRHLAEQLPRFAA